MRFYMLSIIQALFPQIYDDAERGDTHAQFNIGAMFANGLGVQLNYSQAACWYRKAAEQGFAAAQSNLGVLYAYGLGVSQDDIQAVAWFHLAAAQGFEKAKFNLEVMQCNRECNTIDAELEVALFGSM